MKTNYRTHKMWFGLTAAVLLGIVAQAADVAGKWIWITPGRNGGEDRTNSLTLKMDDSKLTGKITLPRRGEMTETPITDAKADGDQLSFFVIREYNGHSFTNKYSGAVSTDKITGKIEFTTRNGETRSRKWEAERANDAK